MLPEYKGIELTKTNYTVSDGYVDQYFESLATTEEVEDEDAVVESGDIVNIAYEGTMDGEVFDGGSSDSYDLEIGSGTFIDGFEDGLIGLKKGEETDLSLQFPDPYENNPDYAGKDVVFHVTVNSISRYAEQDDDWVNTYTSGEYTSVDDFKAYLKESIESSLASNSESAVMNEAWTTVFNDTDFVKLMQSYIDDGKEQYDITLATEAATYGYESADEYIEASGITEEDAETYKENYAVSYAKSVIFAEAILEAEGIAADSDEVNAKYDELEEQNDTTIEELQEQYGEKYIYMYAVCAVANEIIADNADITETTEEYTGA